MKPNLRKSAIFMVYSNREWKNWDLKSKSKATLPNWEKKVRVTIPLISQSVVKKINMATDRQ